MSSNFTCIICVGVLLCPIMKLVAKRSFLYILEDITSINKMNWDELVFAFLVHDIKEFNKQSGVFNCLYLYIIFFSNYFFMYYKMWQNKHISLEKHLLLLSLWENNKLFKIKWKLKKFYGFMYQLKYKLYLLIYYVIFFM